ncbi:LuxR family transcriptional regulator [Aestuariicoccus sp. MJ-SS9]|uniref:helix-turn-helix transcriptional regulator n=1 Tax=Aestuariicoccus sp. MJ-SS9 TaxID=3079855 RepID=UPI0029061467|nr:LuxR family transcriptional regulator [Aestuariicoccus sp. MJ-SS9]MDU8913110.1 LuxR family transcriptional regulator [Aestuariicoccus sp. MJ-SS9]
MDSALHDVMTRLMAAREVVGAWDILATRMTECGFPSLIYGGSRIAHRGIVGQLDEALILHQGPQSYSDAYLGEELYLHSPTYDWAMHHTGAASWAEVGRQYSDWAQRPEVKRMLALNAEHGLMGGYVISLVSTGGRGGAVMGLSPGGGQGQDVADALWAEHGDEIVLLCNLFQLRVASLPQPMQSRPLTTRQREVLEWMAEGKTTQDIAVIMGLSAPTIEKHLKGARQALQVTNSVQAVQKATALNLLFGSE